MRRIEVEKMWCATNHMKIGKGNGPSGVGIELSKLGGDKCLKSLKCLKTRLMISCSRISYRSNGCRVS